MSGGQSLAVATLSILLLIWLVARRVGRRPPAPVAPDWSAIDSYSALARAANEAHWLAPDAFLDGPWRRFLELTGAPDESPRARARMMEFGRGALHRYCVAQGEQGDESGPLWQRARAMAEDWLMRADPKDGDYMLEVLDGISNHNWRGPIDEEEEEEEEE